MRPALHFAALAPIVLTAPAAAQELVRLEARVSSVFAGGVWIDRGHDALVREDDRVLFPVDGGVGSEGRVRAVTRNAARVELLPGSQAVLLGARAQVELPRERGGAAGAAHPPWRAGETPWDPARPLLAPAFGTDEEDRERHTTGRITLRADGTFDQRSPQRGYLLGALGLDLRTTNPFGSGGELVLDAEVFQRETDTGASSDSETTFSPRQLSYRIGGTEREPARFEFGRFLQHEFPELGVLDGVEWNGRFADGSRLVASAGFLPEPTPEMRSGDDLQAALGYRWAATREQQLTLGAVYQNTWHEGEQDRNLFVGTLDWDPGRSFGLHGTTWLDFYGPGDGVKDDGFELTELSLAAIWRPAQGESLTLSASQRRFPELLRQEFAPVSNAELEDGLLERVGLSGWKELGARTRANARVDLWRDEEDSGTSFELGMAWSDLLWKQGELALSGFYTDGSFSSGPGARLSATKAWERSFATFAYTYTSYDQKDFTGSLSTLAGHSLFGSLDLPLGRDWTLSTWAEDRFGDELSTYTLGLMLQMRF